MNIVEFIDHVLVTEIYRIQQCYEWKHAYLSFGLISQGIEFLGACIDKREFNTNQKGASSARFNMALKKFFGARYHPFAINSCDFSLYRNLRYGLLHIVIPTTRLALGERSNVRSQQQHLQKYQDENGQERQLLIAEDFYEDFKKACNEVMEIIKTKNIFVRFPETARASDQKKDILGLKRDFLNTNIVLNAP